MTSRTCFRSLIPGFLLVTALSSSLRTMRATSIPGPTTDHEASICLLQAPLDPLTPAETETAKKIASEDLAVKRELGTGRQRLIQVQFFQMKSASPRSDVGRYAAVLFYRYDIDRGIHVIVNLNDRTVVQINRVVSMAVPLAREEIKEAFALALRNRRVRVLLGARADQFGFAEDSRQTSGDRIEGHRVIASSPRDPCRLHRCIELQFRTRNGYVPATSVTVDLSTQTVTVMHLAN